MNVESPPLTSYEYPASNLQKVSCPNELDEGLDLLYHRELNCLHFFSGYSIIVFTFRLFYQLSSSFVLSFAMNLSGFSSQFHSIHLSS